MLYVTGCIRGLVLVLSSFFSAFGFACPVSELEPEVAPALTPALTMLFVIRLEDMRDLMQTVAPRSHRCQQDFLTSVPTIAAPLGIIEARNDANRPAFKMLVAGKELLRAGDEVGGHWMQPDG